mmetsp:Transcript_39940/g.120757  ORF Transcript_39940/g.120757 Transcript_39940/m.120757 type:complete len:289 (-) Transcript_39940:135-1001(-)
MDLVLTRVQVDDCDGHVHQDLLAIGPHVLLLDLHEPLVAAGRPVLPERVACLDHEAGVMVTVLLLHQPGAVAQRLLRQGVEVVVVARLGRREVAHPDAQAHLALPRPDGAGHGGRVALDQLVGDDHALGLGRLLGAWREESHDYGSLRRKEADAAQADLLLPRHWAKRGLDAGDRVRRADERGDIDLPTIIQPLVGPAAVHEELALLRVVAHGRVLPRGGPLGPNPSVFKDSSLPLQLLAQLQHAHLAVERAHAPTLALVGGPTEDEHPPRGNGLHEQHRHVPPGHIP